jgi:hypothetical protein
LADTASPKTPPRAEQKAIKRDELDAMVQAYQKQRWDAETAKIARLKALRLNAQTSEKSNAPEVKAKGKPIKHKARPPRYLGGYE